MKRFHIVLLNLVLALALCGCSVGNITIRCSREEENQAPPVTETVPAVTEPETAEIPEETATETFAETMPQYGEVVRISDTVPMLGDRGFQQAAFENDYFSAAYYRLPHYATQVLSDRAFLVCTDQAEMKQGSHYAVFLAENGALRKVDDQEVSKDFLLSGHPLYMRYSYAEYAPGYTALTYVPEIEGQDFRYYSATRSEGWLLGAPYQPEEVEYPMKLDPATGRVTDLLAGLPQETAAEILGRFLGFYAASPEGDVLFQGKNDRFCFFDASAGRYYNLNEIVGGELMGASPIWERECVLCWDGSGNAWAVELTSMTAKQVFSGADLWGLRGLLRGNAPSFLIEKLPQGGILIHDFLTDTTAQLDISLPDNTYDTAYYSPDGRKLAVCTLDERGACQIGVWDCDSRRWLEIDRENPNTSDEELPRWTPDGSLAIRDYQNNICVIYTLK